MVPTLPVATASCKEEAGNKLWLEGATIEDMLVGGSGEGVLPSGPPPPQWHPEGETERGKRI